MPQEPNRATAPRMSKLLIRTAAAGDLDLIRPLLQTEGLPVSDLEAVRPGFLLACAGTQIAGAGALERYGEAALLRSLVVAAPWRGGGLGHRLVKSLERQARATGVHTLVLLTQSAQAFFARLDYQVIAREQAPAAVRTSSEFRTLCPASAICMAKTLR